MKKKETFTLKQLADHQEQMEKELQKVKNEIETYKEKMKTKIETTIETYNYVFKTNLILVEQEKGGNFYE